MANLSIREAVKHFDVSRPTLTKALKIGKISGIQDTNGQWSIDPSELSRIYKPRSNEGKSNDQGSPASFPGQFPSSNILDPQEIELLREQLLQAEARATIAETRADAAEVLAKERAERIEDLRRMLPAPAQAKRRRWWSWK